MRRTNEARAPRAVAGAGDETVVNTRDLVKVFGRTRALDGLSLSVKRGEKYGLLGPNGSGKTTLIRSMVGLVQPDHGQIEVLGEKVPSPFVSRRVGYMTQAAALYEDLTVRENLRFFARLFGARDVADRVEEVLTLVGLADRGSSPVRTLSGGMRQRASLAAALVHKPELMLLDEPSVGVDPELRLGLWDHFDRLNREGRTFVISTHVMDEAERCTRVAFMRAGRLLAEGSPRELKEQTGTGSLEEAYLWYARKGDQGRA
ncbi:MAG: ABC transporter ATP-binding protein [Bacillota bacterium]|nr:MAG: ABC transporter ATP-binding protein [Bacillota bacterium]